MARKRRRSAAPQASMRKLGIPEGSLVMGATAETIEAMAWEGLAWAVTREVFQTWRDPPVYVAAEEALKAALPLEETAPRSSPPESPDPPRG